MKKKLPPIKRQRGPHDGAGNNIISKLKCLELIPMLTVAPGTPTLSTQVSEREVHVQFIYLSTYTQSLERENKEEMNA